MRAVLQDLRFAVRMILKNPAFTAVAVATLAVGIGANTAFFSLLDAVLLRPLPLTKPEQLVLLKARSSDGSISSDFAYPDYLDLRDRSRSLSGLASFNALPLTLTVSGASERIFAQGVSGNYFQVVGRGAALGRALLPQDDRPGAEPVVVLSHHLWRSRFGGDPGVIGRSLLLEGQHFTIVGVAPRDLQSLARGFAPELWLPVTKAAPFDFGPEMLTARNMRWLEIVGRLREKVGAPQAQGEMRPILAGIQDEHPMPGGRRADLVLAPAARGDAGNLQDVSRVSLLLMAVTGIVLLIACANVGSLMLARASERKREIAIRLALGAGRARLVRQLLTESLLLALLGGAAGLTLATWSSDLLAYFRPQGFLPVVLDVRLDVRVLGFCAAASLLAALLFGLAPALQASRPDLVVALKADSGASLPGYSRVGLRTSLVVLQVAMALVLLLGGGLFLRSLRREEAVDPGFDPRHVLALSMNTGREKDEARAREFYRQLVAGARALPGVSSAAMVSILTPSPGGARMTLDASDLGLSGGGSVDIDLNWTGPGYFSTLGIPILRGREFSGEDLLASDAPERVIVNESLARLLWPGQDPVGKRFHLSGPGNAPNQEVIGVAKDGKYRSLREAPLANLYMPLRQLGGAQRTLVVRAAGDPASLIAPLRHLVQTLDAGVPVYGVRTLEEHVAVALLPARLTTWLVGIFSLVALGLSALGLYGLVSHAVLRRTREIGVRMALGARRGDVLRMVVRQGMRLILAGIALGLLAAAPLTRLVSSLLFGVSPVDPLTFAAIPLLLAGVALLACWLPARRAANVDPIIALRYE